MNEQSFVNRREPDWQRITMLCDKADTSVSRLSAEELRELVRLYRRVSTDLSLARTKSSNLQLIDFLNDLAGRAYAILYREPRKPLWNVLLGAVELSAQTVRRRRWFVFTSILILVASCVAVYALVALDPQTRSFFIPPGAQDNVDAWKLGRFPERSGSEGFMMAGFYASNNPKVAIISGAVGAGSFGILSVLLIAQNGAMLGVLAHEVATVGKLGFLASSIFPHGVPEMSGMIISGASGLLLGYALINPGRRSRGDALREVGRDAIVLLATSVVMMFIAAPIEGFFSFNPRVPWFVKVAVGVVSLAAWLAFWSFFGRTEDER